MSNKIVVGQMKGKWILFRKGNVNYHLVVSNLYPGITNEKTNMLTESIMLFYREAFPITYQFAGCAPTDKATIEVPSPIKNGCVSK